VGDGGATRATARRVALGSFVVTALVVAVALIRVLLSGTDPANTSAPGYLPLAYSAAAVLLVVFVLSAFVRRVDLVLGRWFPWLVGAVSAFVGIGTYWVLWAGNSDLAATIYKGIRVPQGPYPFWDLTLVMKSIDCARVGVDVFQPNNGCLQDPAIYGPGMLWLQYLPFHLFANRNTGWLGLVAMIVSSLVLVWLARNSSGPGQLVLLVAAAAAPWQLLLERGNIDAAVLWIACAVVLLVRRWDRLWVWWIAAALIWLVGTWKYYPFAMGLMLVPAVRVKRGWTVLVGFGIATVVFMVLTWDNFRFSSQSNSNMVDYGDFVVLGRVPVVARMLGTVVGAGGIQLGDAILFMLALIAVVWGAAAGLATRRSLVHPAMLAIAGSSLFLASVLVAGFGWGYKAAFLLLCVPAVAALTRSCRAVLASSSVAILAMIAIQALVVWNTVMATLAGVVAAGFAFGLAATLIARAVRPAARTTASVAAPARP
jgi:hypothetical protein